MSVQIHLSETRDEVENCIAEHGVRPAFHLDRAGLLGPNTILAHGVWLDEEELDLIAERGATVVTNPVANLKLAVGGLFPYLAARERGVAMGIGTDGPGSNNSLDLALGPEDVRAPSEERSLRCGGGRRRGDARPRQGRDVGSASLAGAQGRRSGGLPPGARGLAGAWRWASWMPVSSMQRRARSSMRRSSPGGCSCCGARWRTPRRRWRAPRSALPKSGYVEIWPCEGLPAHLSTA